MFNKKELSSDTKLAIHKSIFRTTILYVSESWVDRGYLVHDLEVSDMNVLRRIARVNRRDQWDNHIRNCDIRENLGKSVCVGLSMCRGCGMIDYRSGFCLQRFRVLEVEVGIEVRSDLEVRGLRLDGLFL